MTKEKLAEIAKVVDKISNLHPRSPELQPLREMLEELDRGLPPATSTKALGDRCRW